MSYDFLSLSYDFRWFPMISYDFLWFPYHFVENRLAFLSGIGWPCSSEIIWRLVRTCWPVCFLKLLVFTFVRKMTWLLIEIGWIIGRQLTRKLLVVSQTPWCIKTKICTTLLGCNECFWKLPNMVLAFVGNRLWCFAKKQLVRLVGNCLASCSRISAVSLLEFRVLAFFLGNWLYPIEE